MSLQPKYKLLIAYDIQQEKTDQYYRYVLGEFVPALRNMGLHMESAWHVAYGKYPERHLVFLVDTWEILQTALETPRFKNLETRLKSYTYNYQRKVVHYENRYQF